MIQSNEIRLCWIDSGVKGEFSYFVAEQLTPNQFLTDNGEILKGKGLLLTGLDCGSSEFIGIAERYLTVEHVQFERIANYFWIESDALPTFFAGVNNSMIDGFFLSERPTMTIAVRDGKHVHRSIPIDRNLAALLSVPESFYLTYQTIPELYIISRTPTIINQIASHYVAKVRNMPA